MSIALACRALIAFACVHGALPGPTLHAQRPAPALAQLAHRAWTIRDGAPGAVNALAQAADGYLWLGTGMGLYRFDGVRFEPFEPPPGQEMPSRVINALLALPDGALWIGYTTGGASVLAGGRLVSYGEREGLPSGSLGAFARDSAGTVWAATTNGLTRLVGGRWQRVGRESGFPGGATADLLVDRRGTLWAAELTGVYALPRGGRRFARRAPSLTTGEHDPGSGAIREAPDGSVWGASKPFGLIQLSDSLGGPPAAGARGYRDPRWSGMFVDRHGAAWALGYTGQIVRIPLSAVRRGAVPPGAAARETLPASPATGISGSFVAAGLEDREGNVWLGTHGGIDQFRATKLTPVVMPPGAADPVIAAKDGGGMWVWSDPGGFVALDERVTAHPEVTGRVTYMHRDFDGGVWVGGFGGLWYGRGGKFAEVPMPQEAAGTLVQALTRDRDGTLWISTLFRGVFRRRGGVWERFVAWPELGKTSAQAIHSDRAGRTWLGYKSDRLALAASGAVRLFSAANGLRVGTVSAIHVRDDRAWVGGDWGVMVMDGVRDGTRFRRLAVASGALHSVSGMFETADGDLWLNSDEGVTRVPAAELRRALGDTTYRARDERFGFEDGLDGAAVHIRPLGTVVEGTDGRLWFTTQTAVAWVDPRHIRRNVLPPTVHIRALQAGGRRYAAERRVELPPRTTSLNIGYTAPSLSVPERARFRYRLAGLDSAWQDAGARREAFYTNLGPGEYRFHVIAANEDGVWNTRGAAIDVVIPPTFVQTDAFLALCAAAATGGAWWLAAWRQRRVAAAMRARFDATLAERARVARELHDTLLSGVAGIAMRLDAVATRAASSTGVDMVALGELREQARHTLVEARQAVVGMRASGDAPIPLPVQLADAARRIFAETDLEARVTHTGAPCRYPPAVEEQVLRIAGEAMTNAREHADCSTVTVTCAYRRRDLCVRVRDDGRGFDPARAGANGHFGLVGMRERAAAVGGRLSIESAPGRGTTVLLIVPLRAPD